MQFSPVRKTGKSFVCEGDWWKDKSDGSIGLCIKGNYGASASAKISSTLTTTTISQFKRKKL